MDKKERELILGNIDFRLKVRDKKKALKYCIKFLRDRLKQMVNN